MTTTLTDIAADIRRVSPGALPESLHIRSELRVDVGVLMPIPDDIAEAVLIKAMVMDAHLARWSRHGWNGWIGEQESFSDHHHGGSLGACYQAWR